MVHLLSCESRIRVFIVAAFTFGACSLSLAQANAAKPTPVTTGTMEIAANFGHSGYSGLDSNKHFNFGGEYAYNFNPKLAILGEYTYLPLGKTQTSSTLFSNSSKGYDQIFGSGVRYSLKSWRQLRPYAVVGAGFIHRSEDFQYTSTSIHPTANGYNVDAGGGVSVYLGKDWGVRPEVRWDRFDLYQNSSHLSVNYLQVSGMVFYQFGGRGKKK
jgi:hypothetical protein